MNTDTHRYFERNLARLINIREDLWLSVVAFLPFLALGAVLLWPLVLNPMGVAFRPSSEYSDLLISHWPNAAYIRDSLSRYGQLPLWNAQIMAGQPFAGDPLSGLWYPPNLLLLMLPLPLAFNLLFVLHIAWAGYGMYRSLRSAGLDPGPSFFGGLVFAGTPKLMAHLGAGHVSLLFALSWTPWLLLAIKRAAEGGIKRGAVAGACLALVILADIRWAYFAGILGLAYWIRQAGWPGLKPERWKTWAPGLAVFGLMAAMLTAILTLPLYQFLMHSARSNLTLAEAGAYALPPLYLLGLFFPDPYGYAEWMTYLGIVPLILAFVGLGSGRSRSIEAKRWFWAGVILLAGGFSLGNAFFVYPVLYRLLPGLSFIRVPARAWFIVIFGMSVLAAVGLQIFINNVRGRLVSGPAWGQRYGLPLVVAIVLLLTTADLIRVNAGSLEARPLPEQSAATEWISGQPGLFRVYSPSYSLSFPDTLQHAEGIDPLHLATFSEFMSRAAGLPVDGYQVIVPAFMDRNGKVLRSSPDAGLLGLLSVKYVAAASPLDSEGLRLAKQFGQTHVYENTRWRPRAWLEGEGRAEVSSWTPNRIEVEATGAGLLVLSEVAYPGWACWVNGVRTPIETAYGLLRSVRLEEGEHTIVLAYRPWPVYAGAGISAMGLVLFVLLMKWVKHIQY